MGGVAQLKYGFIRGTELNVAGVWAASQTVRQRSGRFVYADAAGRMVLNADAVQRILGHADYPGDTSTSAGDACLINVALDAVYRIPVNSGTYVIAMNGDTCDISISSNIQGAQLDASDENTLIVVDGDLVNNAWVDVMINPAVRSTGNGVDD